MNKMYKFLLPVLLCAALAGCQTFFHPIPANDKGYFVSSGAAGFAATAKRESIDFNKFSELAVVVNGDFLKQEISHLGMFDEVLDYDELQRRLVKMDLVDKIPQIDGHLGMKKVSDEIGPFLWIRWDEESRDGKEYIQLVAIDPTTAEDVFVTESAAIRGQVNDQNTFYPMLNSFSKWLQEQRAASTTAP